MQDQSVDEAAAPRGIPTPLGSRFLPRVDFRILGPIEVVGAEGAVPLGGPKQRAVLAHLLIRANRLLTTEALIDAVWPDDPPDAPKTSLRAYVSNLRKALGPSRIEGRAPGYLLRVDPDEVDAMRFGALVRDARRVGGDPVRAAAVLRDALALWRGPAFADLHDLRSLEGEIARLEELRLLAMEERIAAELAAGRHDEVLGEVELLTREHLLRERLWGHLMLARYRAGRQAEALAAFDEARRVLADELGIDPSPELRRLHEQILHQDAALELRGQPLRGYRLLERIGEGAFGVVHRALQPQVGREVAIKSIHPELANDPDFVRRFEREAQFVARLEHPHVVPLYDYWREPDAAYLVMRFLRGGSLRTRLEDGDGLAPDEVATLLDQIADALSAAHQQGVVHRDVKPENVLLDEDGRAYLSDFGIAKDLEESRTTRSGAIGTPAYLSPEQIRGEPVTPATDLYALGVLLYEVLTGRHPFPEGSLATLMQQHLHDPVPSVLAARPELSSGVDVVIARATAKDPSLRFADAPALAAAFRSALGTYAAAPSRIPALRVANPYKGLRPFDESDAPDFFGRDALVARLLARLAEDVFGARLLAVVGPSGSGKSSVVSAGLLPALRRGALEGSGGWFFAEMTPGAHAIEELEGALLRVAIDPPASLIEQLERDEHGLLRAVKRILPDDGSELVLFVDQLEELFTLTDDERTRSQVLASIAAAVADPNSRLRVIATLRADFYDRPLLHPRFGELLGARTEAVTPLAPDELERAIDGPAERMGVAPEQALVAEIVADVADEPGALPLLQYALTELFERREDRSMTLAAYHEIGGVSGALARRADQLFDGLDEPRQRACRQLLLHLVALGEGTEDTRRRVTRAELDTLEVDREAMDAVIEAFGRHRLLSFDRDPLTRGPTVELAHEALLRAWGRLQGWIDEARDDVRTRHRLGTAAAEWEASGREPSFLLSGARLGLFESWSETSELALARREREYLKESLERRDVDETTERRRVERERALERRSVRRMRGLVAVLAVAAVVAATLTGIATNQRNEAERARLETRARELAAAAEANLAVDPERSIYLALAAVDATRAIDGTVLPEAVQALQNAMSASRSLATLSEAGWTSTFGPRGTLLVEGSGETTALRDPANGEVVLEFDAGSEVTNVDYNATTDAVLLAGADGRAIVFDGRTGEERTTLGPVPSKDPGLYSARMSPDGSRVVTVGRDKTPRIWEVESGELLAELPAWDGFIEVEPEADVISFSEDGGLVAVAGLANGTGGQAWVADVWSLDPLGPIRRLRLPGFIPADVDLSPDGSRLVAGTFTGDIRVFDVGSGEALVGHHAHAANVFAVEFSPDGERVATASSDGTAKVFAVSDSAVDLVFTLLGHTSSITDVAFDRSGDRVVTGSDDGTSREWDVSFAGGKEFATLPGPKTIWNGDVNWDPTGQRVIATSGPVGTVKILDVETGEHRLVIDGHARSDAEFKGVFGIDVSPDGARIATSSQDGSVRVWDSSTAEELLRFDVLECAFEGGPCWNGDVVFSPDGTMLAMTSDDLKVRVLDSTTGQLVGSFSGHEDILWGVRFSPDGRRVASASWDGTIRVWQVDGSGRPLVLRAGGQQTSVAFSPDGRTIATAGFDGRVAIWDSDRGRRIRSWGANQGDIFDLAFSPDGTSLASAGSGGETGGLVKLWDPRTGTLQLTLSGHTLAVVRLAFSPDGRHLATSSGLPDGTVRVWTLDLDELIDVARSRLTRPLSELECRQYRLDCPATD